MRFRSLWMLAAAGLLLAACRSDGERGDAVRQERGTTPQGARQAQVERAATAAGVDEAATARLLASIRTVAQGELDAGRLAQRQASSPEVKDYATRAVAEYQANLDALSDLAKAKKIDLESPTVQNDPLLKALKDTAREAVDRLRTLSGMGFDATYMTAQRPSQAFLVQLAQGGPQVSRDPDVGNVLRTMAQQGKDRTAKALSILPKACGGERAGWGGTG